MSNSSIRPCTISVLGAAAIDWVAQVDELPRLDGISWVKQYDPFPGGSGANMASAVARLGKSVRFIGRLGDDDGGNILWNAFQQAGVDTAGIRIEKNSRTASCFIGVDSHGNREIYSLGGVALFEHPEDLSPEWFNGTKVLLISDAYCEVALTAIALCDENTKIIFSPGGLMVELPGDQLDSLLAKTNVLVINQVEAGKITGFTNPQTAIKLLVDRGSEFVIITLGKDGLLVWDGEKASPVPAFQCDSIVDTTGAGDAFVAGFAVGLMENLDMLSAARLGNAVSAFKIRHFGARNGIPNLQQAINFTNKYKSIDEEVNP